MVASAAPAADRPAPRPRRGTSACRCSARCSCTCPPRADTDGDFYGPADVSRLPRSGSRPGKRAGWAVRAAGSGLLSPAKSGGARADVEVLIAPRRVAFRAPARIEQLRESGGRRGRLGRGLGPSGSAQEGAGNEGHAEVGDAPITAARDAAPRSGTDDEREAMRKRAVSRRRQRAERPAAKARGRRARPAAKIAEMPDPVSGHGRAAPRHHHGQRAGLSPRTWYGTPAYAKATRFSAS